MRSKRSLSIDIYVLGSCPSTETTATIIDVSSTMSFIDGALLKVIDANSSFEDTELVHFVAASVKYNLLKGDPGNKFSLYTRPLLIYLPSYPSSNFRNAAPCNYSPL